MLCMQLPLVHRPISLSMDDRLDWGPFPRLTESQKVKSHSVYEFVYPPKLHDRTSSLALSQVHCSAALSMGQ